MNSVSDARFQELYDRLNKEQKKAVDTVDGPVMVIAGPGTGKTSILTLRIAQILRKTDTAPSAILALTFTESGVRAMRKKLIDIIGARGYEVRIHTFHGFCNEIIRSHPERFPRIIGGRAVGEVEQVKMLEDIILKESQIKLLRPVGDPLYYIKPSLRAIEELKREYQSPDDLVRLVKEEQMRLDADPDRVHVTGKYKGKVKGEFLKRQEKINKNQELALLYKRYEESLAAGHLFDYNDMIIEVIKALKTDEQLLLELQENHQYILADEHQDANQSQNTLLELLSGFFDQPNLFIVGDEKQAIFRFQGASLENFLYFKKRFPDALLIQLKTNYRSKQSILDLSHALIKNNILADDKLRVELSAGSKFDETEKAITLREFQDERNELRFLGEEIARKVKQGSKASEIAVLYRENREAEEIGKVLRAHQVPFVVHSDTNLFEDEGVFLFLNLLKLIHEPHNDQYLITALLAPFSSRDYSPVEVMAAVSEAKKSREKFAAYLLAAGKETSFARTYEAIIEDTKRSVSEPLVPFLESVMAGSGFIEWIMRGTNSVHRLKLVHVLLGLAQNLVSRKNHARLGDFLDEIRVHEEHGLLVKGAGGDTGRDEVHLMTAHRSKGLEFDTVYLVRLVDKHWGNNKARSYFDLPHRGEVPETSLEDERRLFYVALTRARKEIFLSHSTMSAEGKEYVPSLFLAELSPDLVHIDDVSQAENRFRSDPAFLIGVPRQSHVAATIFDREYILHQIKERGFSVTAINNYLACPWKFFFSNLVRIPEGQNFPQMYGTAIHETLRRFFEQVKKGIVPETDQVMKWYQEEVHQLPFSERDIPQVLEKGEESLRGFIEEERQSVNQNIFTEYSIRGVNQKVQLAEGEIEIPLNGKLDKIEITGPGMVNVYDFKTGKPKSRNDIEGKTKSSDGNYKRQLVFYSLLLSLEGKNRMNQGIIQFVEPDDSGNYRKEGFFVEVEEVKGIIELINKITREVVSGDFMEKGCEEKDCQFCRLARAIREESR